MVIRGISLATTSPSRSWKPCFQNAFETLLYPWCRPSPRVYDELPVTTPVQQFLPTVPSPCFNKIIFLHQRRLQEFFLGRPLRTPRIFYHPSLLSSVSLSKINTRKNVYVKSWLSKSSLITVPFQKWAGYSHLPITSHELHFASRLSICSIFKK